MKICLFLKIDLDRYTCTPLKCSLCQMDYIDIHYYPKCGWESAQILKGKGQFFTWTHRKKLFITFSLDHLLLHLCSQ